MENLPELSGYVASPLVLLSFFAKDMRVLRILAIFSNLDGCRPFFACIWCCCR